MKLLDYTGKLNTHEKYFGAIGEDFKNYVTAVFTDEPKAPFATSNKELQHRYEEMYGEKPNI